MTESEAKEALAKWDEFKRQLQKSGFTGRQIVALIDLYDSWRRR